MFGSSGICLTKETGEKRKQKKLTPNINPHLFFFVRGFATSFFKWRIYAHHWGGGGQVWVPLGWVGRPVGRWRAERRASTHPEVDGAGARQVQVVHVDYQLVNLSLFIWRVSLG